MNVAVLRAHLLISQRRFDMAQSVLRGALGEDGQDAELHYLLALCLGQAGDHAAAESEARIAVGLAPGNATCHRILAGILIDRHKYKPATAAIEEAIALDATDVEGFSTLAQLRYALDDWPGLLAASEAGLALDPEHSLCNNWRAIALVKLGRGAEAGQTLDATLARNPEDPLTHANQGWSKLERGEQAAAFDHFREALAADPTMNWARAGIVEAIKSRNFIYRWLLRYFLYLARLSSRTRWLIVIGGFLMQRMLLGFADTHPEAAPFCAPLIIAYAVFALLTWLADPLFTLLLMSDKFARRSLSSDQRWRAIYVGSVLLAASIILAVALTWYGSDSSFLGLWSALDVAVLSIPTSAIHACSVGWPRRSMLLVTLALAVLAVAPISVWVYAAAWPTAPAAPAVIALALNRLLFIPGLIASQFLAMWLAQVRPVR